MLPVPRYFPLPLFEWSCYTVVGVANDGQELDSKAVSRIEKAVSKSEFSQGKKLKVITKVCGCTSLVEWRYADLCRSTPTLSAASSSRLVTVPSTSACRPSSPSSTRLLQMPCKLVSRCLLASLSAPSELVVC